MAAEGSGDVVVFAMNVVGNCSAYGYIFRSRCDGQKESARDGEVENLCERGSCFAAQNAGSRVEVQEAVHAAVYWPG